MSDLAATNCGCDNGCDNGCGCNTSYSENNACGYNNNCLGWNTGNNNCCSILWIIILLCFCGNGNSLGNSCCNNRGNNDYCWIIIVLLFLCGGCGNNC